MLLVIEAGFVALGAVGVALWSVPAALLVVALCGVLACERAAADRIPPRGGERR